MTPANHFRAVVPNPDGKYAYPIVTFTWILAYKKYADASEAEELKEFLNWCLTKGQDYNASLGYIRMPEETCRAAMKAVARIQAK
jgi:phosphate transport system substrate-binding protein